MGEENIVDHKNISLTPSKDGLLFEGGGGKGMWVLFLYFLLLLLFISFLLFFFLACKGKGGMGFLFNFLNF